MTSFSSLLLELRVMIAKLYFWDIFHITDATCNIYWKPSAEFWAASCKRLCALAIVSPSSLSAVVFVLESLRDLPPSFKMKLRQSDKTKHETPSGSVIELHSLFPWSRALELHSLNMLYKSLRHAQTQLLHCQKSKAAAHLLSCFSLLTSQEAFYKIEGLYGNWPGPDAIKTMAKYHQERFAVRVLEEIIVMVCVERMRRRKRRGTN